jgi:hypothetical protein
VAGLAGALGPWEGRAYPVPPVGGQRSVEEGISAPGGEADNEYAMIDSTIVRAHQHRAGAQKKTVPTKPSGAAKAG